jgi:transposase
MLLPPSVEEYVGPDNPIRAIDAYVDSLDLTALGFTHADGDFGAGQPAYAPAALLKLYIYGYLMRVRSSRMLERETHRNVEVMWLIAGLRPTYKTIADFRKDNAGALKATHRDFVLLCQELDLYGAELVAIDGSFFRGNVAKASIHTESRLKRRLKRIDQDIDTYLKALEQADADNAPLGEDRHLVEKLALLKQRQVETRGRLKALKNNGETQYAEVDPDARLLQKNGQVVAGYNVQIAVDSKHKLLVEGEVTHDGNDTQQLLPMATRAKEVLGVNSLTVTADAGYHNVTHLTACPDAGITPYVPEPTHRGPMNPVTRLPRAAFTFEPEHNRYRCPQSQVLNWRRTVEENGKRVMNYVSQRGDCATCPQRNRCLPAKTPYREIYRYEHEDAIDAHRKRQAEHGEAYRRQRACLAEHPFGTLKRWCGWTHFLVRGFVKVGGEMALLMLCYNFRRVISILGIETWRERLRQRRKRHPGTTKDAPIGTPSMAG